MPKKKNPKMYFGDEQEKAVIMYLESTNETEKNKIFNEYLELPLTTMIDSIIRRYKLYRKEFDYQELHTDTLSFLLTKINKFDHTKNHKAYSYFGTICKNYLMGAIQKDNKDITRNISYEDISEDLESRLDYSYTIDNDDIDYSKVIEKFSKKLESIIEDSGNELNENEVKLGYALIELFNNYNILFELGSGNKFNKNLVLYNLREMTLLSTKDIRLSLRKYKKLYGGVLSSFLD